MDKRKKATVVDASTLERDLQLDADVVIIGTGAGGGFAAEELSAAGLSVVMLEAGGYYQAAQFSQNEGVAFPMLYQQAGAQRTADQQIGVLQGQAVGGTTVINWTTSFRTPEPTLAHWAEVHGLRYSGAEAMAPWFDQVEQRLNIGDWTQFPPNENNAALARGCAALGIEYAHMQRNVRGCANTGLCGLGCPVNAKQSMLVTTIPAAMTQGARLIHRVRAQRLRMDGHRVAGVDAVALDGRSIHPTGRQVQVNARHVVLSAGAIRSPGLLLRSGVTDPAGLTGTRTFLHPVNGTVALMPEPVHGAYGAPQSVYSDAFLWPADARMGYKLETTPMQPISALALFDKSYGAQHARVAQNFNHLHSQIALMRDGFDPRAAGGTVVLDEDGDEILDYPISDYLRAGFDEAMAQMTRIQFAAGARSVMPFALTAPEFESQAQVEQWLQAGGGREQLFGSAHVMGGCIMGPDASKAVVDEFGNHHHADGLSVIDGSIFPSSIGANPQVSIYGFSLRAARQLAVRLS